METLCPTCGGKGTINDPTISGSMSYCDSDGNAWPQTICKTCGGDGWIVDKETRKKEYWPFLNDSPKI